MKFTIHDTEFTIQHVGQPYKEGEFTQQPVTFLYPGGEITRDILVSEDEAGNAENFEDFYMKNQQGITDSLVRFLTENNLYAENNRQEN